MGKEKNVQVLRFEAASSDVMLERTQGKRQNQICCWRGL